jgi:endonuclease YncB( thermonuclease family)
MDTPPPRPASLKTMWLIIVLLSLFLLIATLASMLTKQRQQAQTPPAITPRALVSSTSSRVETVEPLEQGKVVDVIDGDTIDVEIEGEIYRVRYIGINAPERDQPFYEEATAANAEWVMDQTVHLERDVSEEDRFGRLLRYVYVDDVMVNEELIRRGLAALIVIPPDVHFADRFRRLEDEARRANLGMWQEEDRSAVPSPTAMPSRASPSPRVAASTTVEITTIFYDGLVPTVEGDEYAEITNVGESAMNLAGWVLSAGDPDQVFTFPDYLLAPGERCRVYTNELHAEWCGWSFESEQAVWSNGGECGTLFNPAGEQVSQRCY